MPVKDNDITLPVDVDEAADTAAARTDALTSSVRSLSSSNRSNVPLPRCRVTAMIEPAAAGRLHAACRYAGLVRVLPSLLAHLRTAHDAAHGSRRETFAIYPGLRR
ncbi:hypothetical protein Val02_82630 [Virgisporangium aliadipatigenens]|uniref:Uncharacterized protein n=1 Tax=Virgisporangium aliadipatigenens TaxID=741659 RepID=A0A8J3YVE0_9ACTN|nr:hypothetical protein [Virgisporangium aliadipatigenens]GIJ51377.1 hypothetical protein Val02_82630 [Virgisporangium aliadipatigenens]